MALPSPDLDDRRFQDLVDDAKRMVMRRCPEWTDHNVSDPGVTLIETFAFMTDQLLFRLNRVPDRMYVKFLDLLGARLLPPVPAQAPVTFWLSAPAATAMTVPAGTNVATLRTETEHSVVFATRHELRLPAAGLQHLMTLEAEGGTLLARDEQHRLRVGFPAFGSQSPAVDDCLLVGLTDAVPRALVSLDFTCRIQGVGVDPDHPPLVWEAWDGDDWQACRVHSDATGGLNRPGAIVLQVPPGHHASILDGRRAGWLRARVIAPRPDCPAYSTSPVIDSMDASVMGGTVDAVHAEMVHNDDLGASDGTGNQRFQASHAPILATAVPAVVEVSSEDGWTRWTEVEHFADSGPDAPHYVVDSTHGTVCFGPMVRQPDGTMRRYGAVPPKDSVVRLRRYATGGGAVGNVGQGAIQTLKSSIPFIARVENLVPATGGVDGESVEEVKSRAPMLMHTRGRAVTAEDFEVITREAAPELARVRCLTAQEAGLPPGAVKVLVVPGLPDEPGPARFAALKPRQSTLDTVARRLDERRLVGTTVLVEPPLYRGVTAVARLRAVPGAKTDRVTDDALNALHRYLNPVTGGPEGTGWPFGRPVQSGDLYAVLQRVDGVGIVEEVRLFNANPVTGERGEETDRVTLDRDSLVFSFEHQVLVEGSGT
ncbi:putative baseplate assembly protein [Streptomyces sp. H27-H1]|uniref:putative baseplate assembly protein n=1 Tax=Streptomyces sp. H27-H1 TaxID=2996461 RepID=UPI00226F23B0|nr:putative baseplate assembly protein [Streptomyces sp. H27-H1]MCY0931980.1 putative baseplate assembly protein [Streptomyces sp. H27-H1]